MVRCGLEQPFYTLGSLLFAEDTACKRPTLTDTMPPLIERNLSPDESYEFAGEPSWLKVEPSHCTAMFTCHLLSDDYPQSSTHCQDLALDKISVTFDSLTGSLKV